MSERFRQFYSEYKNKLFSYLMYKSGDREVALDIMQESFTRYIQRYDHVGKVGSASNTVTMSPALLYTIARNALIDFQRNQGKLKRTEHFIPQAVPDEEASFIAREESARMKRAIAKLPEQDREILVLAVGGVAYKEIAEISNLSVANVKVRIHRARTRLRQMLNIEVQ